MRVYSIKIDQIFMVLFGVAILWSMAHAFTAESAPAFAMPVSKRIVLIDAGHGGFDPGKVSGNVLEKDINLAIALKLQGFLEEGGATVLMTRIEDKALSTDKSSDMYRRKEIANAGHVDIFISIHQNSFGTGNVHGAQVFYYNTSDDSRRLAEHIQRELRGFVDPDNRLQARANTNYFVLKQTAMPAVIVECGFLSNYAEKMRLTKDEYQERIAWGIYLGIVAFFNEK